MIVVLRRFWKSRIIEVENLGIVMVFYAVLFLVFIIGWCLGGGVHEGLCFSFEQFRDGLDGKSIIRVSFEGVELHPKLN